MRFPGFKESWELKKLGELLEFKNGINASKEQYGSGIKFINVLDILSNDFITYENIVGKVNVDEKTIEKFLVSYGDVLFQRSSETREEVGTANVYLDKNKNATFGGFVIRGRKIGDYNPIFFNKLLKTNSARENITSKSGGSTRFNVGQEILSSVNLYFPNLFEQDKIASFLSIIDERIQTQKKIIEGLQALMKGNLERVFYQKLRFKNKQGNYFSDWKTIKLDEICDIKKGEQLNKEDLTETGNYPCLNGGMSFSGYTDKFNSNENTITISEGGNSCGFVSFMKSKFWLGGHCYKIILKKDISTDFFFYLLKFYEREIMNLRVGSGLPNIQQKDLKNLQLLVSQDIEEQTKIANFLSSIQEKIEIEKQILEKLELQKKFLLSNLFV
ncbi:restriction endonuclease subunit S [Chryseobacterium pennipullorum]|uniref:Restriction endonuclease subunit S n=1 Tax=Chryseobacterium pennipullorum TaxID=2258963 RepID=A0A3D9ASC9_9FLAO|nr:restriction endonuclease subunit S [Chryseobacterium pennipullorum]